MKKAVIILTTLIMSFQFILFEPYQKAQAVGVDTAIKLVGGKAVIRALAEKAGMALSKKQVDNVAGYIQKKTYDGDQKAIDFSNNVNALASSGASERSGFKKYILDPFNWITGLDLVFGAIMAFQQGYDNGQSVDIVGQCVPPSTGYPILTGGGWVSFVNPANNAQLLLSWTSTSRTLTISSDGDIRLTGTGGSWKLQSKPVGGSWNSGSTFSTEHTNVYDNSINIVQGISDCVNPVTPVASDVPDITNVNSSVIQYFDNDTYNNNVTYNIEIEMPDSPNYDDMTPWNDADPTLGDVLSPIKPDSDGDGLTDDVDPFPDDPSNIDPTQKPEGSSWWEWLLKPLKAIGDFFADVGGFLLGILVPSADSVTGIFNGISDSFKAKIPIADQLGIFFGEIEEIQATETPTAPTFDVTMPVEWGGGTFPMIDFSYFDQWRTWVLNFIRFTAWFIFLKRLYARIPRMVY